MAQSPANIVAGLVPAFAYESISVTSTAKSLTSATYTDDDGNVATKAIITIETAQIRWRMDGTNPTSSEGHLNNPFDTILLNNSSDIKNFRIIRASSNATIRVSYSN